jgi:glyoxylase-like metal-dependent hydrolase (beta-lactamase superfamily II)
MKKLLTVVLLILLVVLIGVSIVLIPAHLQIRSVNTALPEFSDFLALKVAGGPSDIVYINTSEQPGPDSVLTHSAFLTRWKNGEFFLIDTGMREKTAIEFGEMMQLVLGGGPAEPHGNIASLLGENIARIAGVGFTHLHMDHTQGLATLCERGNFAAVLLQTDFQRTEQNFNTSDGAQLMSQSCLKPGDIAGGPVFTSEQFPGLGIVHLGGHTPGSTLFAVWIAERLYLFSGDITNSKQDLLEEKGKGWVYSNLLVPEDTARTAQLRQWLRALSKRPEVVVVVSHDLGDIQDSGLSEFVR